MPSTPPMPLMPQQNTWMIPSSQTTPVSPIPPVPPVLPMPPDDLPTYQKFVSLQNSCPSVKPSKLFLSLFKDSSFFVTSPQDLRDLWYRKLSVTISSFPSTRSPILVYVEQGEFYLQVLFGHLYPKMFPSGPEPAYPARKTRFTVMCTPLFSISLYHLDVHIDLVGPLPACQGYTYLLTMMDRIMDRVIG